MNKVRTIKNGEALAMDPKFVRAGREAFFWLWSNPNPVNERVGENKNVAVVHVRGPLEHHSDGWGDSYDALVCRFGDALSGEDCEKEGEASIKPDAVILKFDTPGGVVSGLNETVLKMRQMAAQADIPVVAFLDEMAASAGYALCCACDEIYLPPSAIAGSIGVISTMVDQTKMDEAMGLRFVTLTSGARKSDGHPHVPITSAAESAEQKRVDKLASQFYRLVQEARGLSPKTIKGYEAGIFVGDEAVEAGLADAVMSWDDIVTSLSDTSARPPTEENPTPTSADPLVKSSKVKSPYEADAMLKLQNLIKSTKAAIAAEKDATKLAALKTKLGSFEATLKALSPSTPAAKVVHKIDHKEVHTDDGDGGGDDDKPEGDEEEEEEAGAEGNETDRNDKPEDDEEGDDAEEEEEEAAAEMDDEEDEEAKKSARIAAKALRSALSGLKGEQGEKLRGALVSVLNKASKFDQLSKTTANIVKERAAEKKSNIIEAALNKKRITPGEAKMLRGKKLGFVSEFLTMRPKAIVHSTQEELLVPKGGMGRMGGLADDMMAIVQKAFQASDGKIPIEKFIEDYKASLNGVAGKQEF
jgi:signal peptide peptidase SppA